MRSADDVLEVAELFRGGLSVPEIARITGIPRSTVQNWCSGRTRALEVSGDACPRCRQRCLPIAPGAESAYAYLLGQYLGDGGIYRHRRGVFRLVIFGDVRYVAVSKEVADAMSTVLPHVSVGHQVRGARRTVRTTYAYSRSWPCLLPQHSSGPKHLRQITLTDWQRAHTQAHAEALIRGLIHSDGCRSVNTVKTGERRYSYTRYSFSNRSDDIRSIFCEHLDLLGIPWRRMNRWNISIARREGVARLDEFVGPKC
jgi:hypothetical protein